MPRKEKYKLERGREEQDKKAQAGCEQERTFLDLGRGGGGGPSPKLKQFLPKLYALSIFFISLRFLCDLLPENTALYINSPEADEVREGSFWNDHIKDSEGDVEFAEEGLLILLRLESKLRSRINKCGRQEKLFMMGRHLFPCLFLASWRTFYVAPAGV